EGTSCVAGACVAVCTGPFALAPPVAYPVGVKGDGAWGVVVTDLTGDGKPDFAAIVANVSGAKIDTAVSVRSNNGDGTFALPIETTLEAAGLASITAADLNGDGRPDLVTTQGSPGVVSVLLNHGDGILSPGADHPAGPDPAAV